MNGKYGFHPKGLSRRVALAALLSAVASPAAFSQSFPSRNVSLVTTVSAGGSIDAVARIIAAGLTKSLGKSVIVDAKPGAGGNVAAGYVANQPPDGHTLIMGNSATVTTNPHIYKSIPFDAEKSFTPIIIPARVNQILVVNPKVEAKTFEEFVALMKANPGKLNYGSSGIGASSHLGAEMLGLQTGTSATHVPYRGIAPAATALLAGQIDFAFDSATTVPHIQEGQLRALAVVGPKRLAALPDVKAFRELGLPDMELANSWYFIAAPAGTPKEVVQLLNAEIKKVLELPETINAIKTMGLEPATSTPEEIAEAWRSDLRRLGPLVKQAKIDPQ
ncbi:MAG: tripartite tricarboxylate transporter substrate binding protein [Xanthobacteraceae bacterium]|nr:tripartite tricarboxylate transporter substrate binding protein [Xanthobacteraceae bacterium]